ncbi:hypothetical protein OIO90_001268 [Microbotryomycetes sp. JL221]|nr:hypothetical protein OIO90_001268 [Microbotryomycetes sp. JL221]
MARARKQAKAAGLPLPPLPSSRPFPTWEQHTPPGPRSQPPNNTFGIQQQPLPPPQHQQQQQAQYQHYQHSQQQPAPMALPRDVNIANNISKLRLADSSLHGNGQLASNWSRPDAAPSPLAYASPMPSPHSPTMPRNNGQAWRHTLDPSPHYFDPYAYGIVDGNTLEPLSYSTGTSPSTSAHASPALEPQSDDGMRYPAWSTAPSMDSSLAPLPKSEPCYPSNPGVRAGGRPQRPRLLHSISLPAPNVDFATSQPLSFSDLLNPFERQLAMLPKHDPNPFYSPDLAYGNLARTDESMPSIPIDYINPRAMMSSQGGTYEISTSSGTVVSSVPFFDHEQQQHRDWHQQVSAAHA